MSYYFERNGLHFTTFSHYSRGSTSCDVCGHLGDHTRLRICHHRRTPAVYSSLKCKCVWSVRCEEA